MRCRYIKKGYRNRFWGPQVHHRWAMWPKRYFLRPLHFFHPLTEGRGTRLTIRNKNQRTLIVRQAGLSNPQCWMVLVLMVVMVMTLESKQTMGLLWFFLHKYYFPNKRLCAIISPNLPMSDIGNGSTPQKNFLGQLTQREEKEKYEINISNFEKRKEKCRDLFSGSRRERKILQKKSRNLQFSPISRREILKTNLMIREEIKTSRFKTFCDEKEKFTYHHSHFIFLLS